MDMADVMKKTNDMMDDVQATAGQLKEISNKINQGAGTMGALVNDRRLYDQLNGATAQAQQGATAFQENMTALKHNFLLRGFFNRRGYEDSSKLTENEIADLPDAPYLRKFVYDGRKLFEAADSARLKGNPKLLDDAGRDLQGNPFGLAIVVARHGMKGDASDVLVLSQARAMNVRDYLVQHFRMDDTRFKTLAVGKDAEGPDDGQIEILVYPTGLKIPPQPPPNKTGRGGK